MCCAATHEITIARVSQHVPGGRWPARLCCARPTSFCALTTRMCVRMGRRGFPIMPSGVAPPGATAAFFAVGFAPMCIPDAAPAAAKLLAPAAVCAGLFLALLLLLGALGPEFGCDAAAAGMLLALLLLMGALDFELGCEAAASGMCLALLLLLGERELLLCTCPDHADIGLLLACTPGALPATSGDCAAAYPDLFLLCCFCMGCCIASCC